MSILYDLEESAYHARPELSSTQARRLLESPARFKYTLEHQEAGKDSYDLGTAVHTKVLGAGDRFIEYPPEHLTPSGNASTKAATVEWVAEQRANGKVVISTTQAAQVDGMAEAVLAHPTARALFEQDGHAEASLFATDPDTGIDMRARFDYLAHVGVDLKTTGKRASTHGFMRSAADMGYEVQQEWYQHIRHLITGEQNAFVFVVVETEAPHLVGVHQLTREFVEIGAAKARRARELFAECTATNVWPGYPTEIGLVPPPVWAVYDYQDNYS